MMNWKGCGRRQSWPNFKLLSQHLPGGTEDNHKNLSEDNRSPSRDLKLGLLEYESGVQNVADYLLNINISVFCAFLLNSLT
jgi:hypothetical protein